MKHSYLKVLGSTQNNLMQAHFLQDQFDDRKQIQELRFSLKNLYFRKRTLYVETLIQMLQQNKLQSDEVCKLKLPDGIQKQRESYFTLNDKFARRRQQLEDNLQEEDIKEEPFFKIKQRIFSKYKLKKNYIEEIKQKTVIDDGLEVQKKFILGIYKNKLKEYYVLDEHNEAKRDQDRKPAIDPKISQTLQNKKGLPKNFNQFSNPLGQVDKINENYYGKGFNADEARSNPSPNYQLTNRKKQKQSVVIQSHKNPNTVDYMKINDPSLEQQGFQSDKPNQRVQQILNEFVETDRDISIKGAQKRLNASFQQSGYNNFLLQQKKQLQEQKKRMIQLTQQANKAIHNQNLTDSQEQIETRSQNLSKSNENVIHAKGSISIDESMKEVNQVKCLFAELIEQFILSETLKFQLQNRTFEMVSKLYQFASIDFKQKIVLQEPIILNTFTIVVKSLLRDDFQLKSEVHIVVNKIFRGKNLINFDEVSKELKSVLNKKEALLFEPIENKTEVDRTIEKTKRLFVTWISMNYFMQKIREVLRRRQFIVAAIMKQCAPAYDSQSFDSSLLVNFFFEGCNSTTQKLKVDIFFRYILGKQLKRKNFIEWYSNESVFTSRYERIGARLSKDNY